MHVFLPHPVHAGIVLRPAHLYRVKALAHVFMLLLSHLLNSRFRPTRRRSSLRVSSCAIVGQRLDAAETGQSQVNSCMNVVGNGSVPRPPDLYCMLDRLALDVLFTCPLMWAVLQASSSARHPPTLRFFTEHHPSCPCPKTSTAHLRCGRAACAASTIICLPLAHLKFLT